MGDIKSSSHFFLPEETEGDKVAGTRNGEGRKAGRSETSQEGDEEAGQAFGRGQLAREEIKVC